MPSITTDALGAAASQVAHSLSTNAATTTPTTAANGTTVTSNDFLKLLVTEMKNQDPTQPTDPNAYIQQLVGVNSLQQLIAINKTLSGQSTGQAAISTTEI